MKNLRHIFQSIIYHVTYIGWVLNAIKSVQTVESRDVIYELARLVRLKSSSLRLERRYEGHAIAWLHEKLLQSFFFQKPDFICNSK